MIILNLILTSPAPTFTDVLELLPEGIEVNGSWAILLITKQDSNVSVGFRIEHHTIIEFKSPNPADAAALLLIWLKEK